jgi:hypothetical protein
MQEINFPAHKMYKQQFFFPEGAVYVCCLIVTTNEQSVASLLVLYAVTMAWSPPCYYNMCPLSFSNILRCQLRATVS